MHGEADLEERIERAKERREPVLLIVDETSAIVYESVDNTPNALLECCPSPGELRPDVRKAAQRLIAATEATATDPHSRSAFIAPGYLMRIRRLKGEAKADLFALVLEPFRNRDSVRVAARRYSLTKREHEILTLILEGAIAQEIAAALHISENTVQGYFKRLLKKTNSRNRAAMVANVLEWNRNTGRAPAPPEEQAKTDTDPRRRIIGKS